MSFLCPMECFVGVFQCLFGMFVPALVIFLFVMSSGGTMCMGSEFMEFGSSLMRFIWHSVPPLGSLNIFWPKAWGVTILASHIHLQRFKLDSDHGVEKPRKYPIAKYRS